MAKSSQQAPKRATARSGVPKKSVALALQGGGAHGAFTWGVLDRLLEDERISIEAISATSAGAMNAVVMAYGFSKGGREGGRRSLAEFWKAVSDASAFINATRGTPIERWLKGAGFSSEFSPAFFAMQTVTQMLSPYQLNPLNYNPLRDVLVRVVDFAHLRSCPITTRLFICATNVRSGKIKVFDNHDLSPEVVLASACLPYIFQAVEIEGEYYWDGGYMGNPAIYPLIYRDGTRDVIVVHINPLERTKLPTTASEIYDRVNEITFNSSLMREMRAIAFVTRLIDEGALSAKEYARLLIHSVRDDKGMAAFGAASKFDTDWEFLTKLRNLGRKRAGEWLARHYDDIGRQSSVDLREVYL